MFEAKRKKKSEAHSKAYVLIEFDSLLILLHCFNNRRIIKTPSGCHVKWYSREDTQVFMTTASCRINHVFTVIVAHILRSHLNDRHLVSLFSNVTGFEQEKTGLNQFH